jgi:flagellar biosynthesis/type III secretory pathway protein FliH
MSGDEELLNFRFRVIALWHMDGRQCVEEHAISMYTLLPTMKNVDARVLLQAIDEMVQCYGDDERKLARRMFWLNLFLRRSEMITPEDKSKVQQRLDAFDQLIEEDEFIQQQRALGREEGREEGRNEGKTEEAQQILINLVRRRFPALVTLAQQKAERTAQLATLNETINAIADTFDEAAARAILSVQPAA